MKIFQINQRVTVPGGRVGTIKSLSGLQATVWFDDEGTDIGYYSVPTLTAAS